MSNNLEKLIVFTSGEQQYGLPLSQLLSIERVKNIATVPNTPAVIEGVILVRGELIAVVDMKNVFEQIKTEDSIHTRLLVCKWEDKSVALLVEEASDIVQVEGDAFQDLQEQSIDRSFSKQLVQMGDRFVTMVDLKAFIAFLETECLAS
ncbi:MULTISPECIES: chemotaxis protein CheW [Shouchella]|uniref:Chemotaxis protein CheW n=2 Tax=Bacillaceae TaxID=186817 RepID=A0A060LY97_9BACI|nr:MULTISPECIES: chemotaxis protein CheW [Bacillaceae]AIC95142.1 chemotaxis protein CheW [Shouchella lehensis G1]KQL57617.1 hypothetical protein AN965_08985 [Alkalicoccobacillus plakortidis]RQW20961.1 purine-binding chemotaxis protein CheW [Bacillus sp. C1-1]